MRINVSRLLSFMKCPQLYSYRYEQGIVPREDEALARDFGTKIHEGLREWYQTFDIGATLARYTATEPVEHEMRGYGEVMLRDYVKRFYLEDRAMRVLLVEKEVEAPFMGHTLVGRLDLVVEQDMGLSLGKKKWHVQHKTVGNTVSLDNYVRQYDLAWHERAYWILAKACGFEIEGTILNLLRKTKVPSFMRVHLPMTPDLIHRFETDAHMVIKRIEDSEYRPQSPDACWSYGRMCSYQSLCLGHPFMEEDWVEREPDYVDIKEGLSADH